MPSTAVEEAVASLAAALEPRASELAERLARTIWADDDGYRLRGWVSAEELLLACQENLEEVLRDLARLPRGGAVARSSSLSTGRQRALQGVPLENLLHAYRLGGRIIWEALLEESQGRWPELLAQGAVVVWEGIDLYSSAVADAYRRAESEIRGRDQARRHDLLHSMLIGTVPAGELDLAQESLGLPAGSPLVLVVADPLSISAPEASTLMRAVGLASEWALLQGHLVGLVAARASRQVADHLRRARGARAGLSPRFTGPGGAPRAYRQAELALRSIPGGAPRVVELDEDLPLVILAASPELSDRLARRWLAPVLALPEGEGRSLLRTVRAYLQHEGSVAATATFLPCHRNTVRNRLRRMEQLTGLDPQAPRHGADLALALRASQLLGLEERWPGPDERRGTA
ncbi:MAG: helix-turn-helix domain-containing protein [Candidatus Dormibacteraeota bacterium]|nr:helix-turn-helix domain-containing protein [Candidatus Dormibacteraeota bacterium]